MSAADSRGLVHGKRGACDLLNFSDIVIEISSAGQTMTSSGQAR